MKKHEAGAYLQAHGAGPDDLIGIYTDRSLHMAVGLLGILKAGERMCRLILLIPLTDWNI